MSRDFAGCIAFGGRNGYTIERSREQARSGKKRQTMARVIGIGKQDFEKIRINDNFYIDKTDFILEWFGSVKADYNG